MTTKDTTVTKATIAECINQEIGFFKEESIAIIDGILDDIKTSLAKDRIVKIFSFGTFLVKNKKERPENIPKTSERVVIQAKKSFLLDLQKNYNN